MFHFLEVVIAFIARNLSVSVDSMVSLVNEILCESGHPFYSNSSCASSVDMASDLASDDNVSLSTAFEDCKLISSATFADVAQARHPPHPHQARIRQPSVLCYRIGQPSVS